MYDKKQKKERRRFLSGFLAGVVAAVVVIAAVFVLPDVYRVARYEDTGSKISLSMLTPGVREKVRQLVDVIDQYYYEEVDESTYQEGLYAGLFDGLDMYSMYYSKDEYASEDESITGFFAGIGAALVEDKDGRVYITDVYEGSPAEAAGLQIQDEILQADEYKAKEMDLDEFVSHIRGEEGTEVELTIRRVTNTDAGESEEAADDGNVETFTKKLTRAQIEAPTVKDQMLSDDVGYISISSFSGQTDDQMRESITSLQEEGMDKLIIDLRDNFGGNFEAACDALDEILPAGLMIYTEDRYGQREEINGTDEEVLDIPIAVLVNGNSASASEVFAGELKDRGVATLVGTQTFGKGIVQSVYQMVDGSGFQITTQKYFTSGGYSVQDEGGVAPDVEIEYEYSGDLSGDYDYLQDNQVKKAMEILEEE
ncbi:MAG: S41 family peptidase [Lachnospiraceae bacterium]|nr:S41 family peptidase [Lachnospiraceae bacterium]